MFALPAGLFAGPAGMITSWFASAFGKIIGILALLAIVATIFGSIYFSWAHTIKEAEDLKLKAQQQELIIKNKNAEIKQLKDLAEIQRQAEVNQVQDNKEIDFQSDAVLAWLAQRTGPDAQAPDIVKDTFRKLYGKKQ